MKTLKAIALCVCTFFFGALQSAAADSKSTLPFNETLCITFGGVWSPNTCTISTNYTNKADFNIGAGESLLISNNTIFSNFGVINNAGTIARTSSYLSNIEAKLVNRGIINNTGAIAALNAISNLPSGKISNSGLIISPNVVFTNDGEITNSNTIDFANGVFTNRGDLINDSRSAVIRGNLGGVFVNDWGGSISNDGIIASYYIFSNYGKIINNFILGNNGKFNNRGKIYNNGFIANRDNFDNLGNIRNFGAISNTGIFTNTGRFVGCITNIEPGVIYGVSSC